MILLSRFFFILLISSISTKAICEVYVFFDSEIHNLTNLPNNFPIEPFDLSKSGKIKSYFNQRLSQSFNYIDNTKLLTSKNISELKGSDLVKSFASEYVNSLSHLRYLARYKIIKIPAVVLDTGNGEYIVYGETNIQKALQDIALYRRSHNY
jgi:hypothetical protein